MHAFTQQNALLNKVDQAFKGLPLASFQGKEAGYLSGKTSGSSP